MQLGGITLFQVAKELSIVSSDDSLGGGMWGGKVQDGGGMKTLASPLESGGETEGWGVDFV